MSLKVSILYHTVKEKRIINQDHNILSEKNYLRKTYAVFIKQDNQRKSY